MTSSASLSGQRPSAPLPLVARWAGNVVASFEAVVDAYRRKTPLRWRRLLVHVQQRRQRRSGFLAAVVWWVRFFTKCLDVLAVGELLTFGGQLLKPTTRTLSHLEKQEAERVFGDSIPYNQVRVDEFSLLAWLGALFRLIRQRRFNHLGVVFAYTVNFTRPIHPAPGNEDMAWLIHELVHIAQMEHVGWQYYPESLAAQFTSGYDYGGLAQVATGRPLARFNREQQGEIARDFYRCLYHYPQAARHYQRQIADLRRGRL